VKAAIGARTTRMQFQQRFHAPIAAGEITCSVRIWRAPRVKVGGRYRVGAGAIEVTAIREPAIDDITPALARRSGFAGVVELLKVAKHGAGERVFLVDFRWLGARPPPSPAEVDEAVADERIVRLQRMDDRADAPWTLAVLRWIGRHPGTRAADLAAALDRDKDTLKRDVRKLKALGLTVSLETGYSLSALGSAVVGRAGRGRGRKPAGDGR
jgi:hypothetical protein